MNYYKNLDLSSIEYVCEETGKLLIEKWEGIPEYESYYQASDLGRVKSLNRTVKGRWKIHTVKQRILKQNEDGRGYLQVILNKNQKRKSIKVHVAVGVLFLGYIQDRTTNLVVDHIKNEERTNNTVYNLQIITGRENVSKDVKNKTSKYTGVSWDKSRNKWMACIKHNRNRTHLGRYVCEYDAHLAYQASLNNLDKYKNDAQFRELIKN